MLTMDENYVVLSVVYIPQIQQAEQNIMPVISFTNNKTILNMLIDYRSKPLRSQAEFEMFD